MNISEVIGKNFTLKNTIKNINGTKVEIKGYADVNTVGNIVQAVSEACFLKGVYHAENREIASRFAMLKYLTDIDVKEDDINEIFKMTQGGNWFSEIAREITKMPIWAEIDLAIDRQIDYIILCRQTAFDKLCADLSTVIKTDNTQNLSDVKEVLSELNKVDKEEFVKAAIETSVKKNKVGGNNGNKKPKGATK